MDKPTGITLNEQNLWQGIRLLNLARYVTFGIAFSGYVYWFARTGNTRFYLIAGLFALLLILNLKLVPVVQRLRGPETFVAAQTLLTVLMGIASPPEAGWFLYVYFVTMSMSVFLRGAASYLAALAIAGTGLAQIYLRQNNPEAAWDMAGAVAAFFFVYAFSFVSRSFLQGAIALARGEADLVYFPAPQPVGEAAAAVSGLTPREVEVLRLVAEGLSNQEIAARLHLSEGTVKNHISNVYAKLGLRDRTQAAIFAIEHGMVSSRRFGDFTEA